MAGEIEENLPNATFRVKLENGHVVRFNARTDSVPREVKERPGAGK